VEAWEILKHFTENKDDILKTTENESLRLDKNGTVTDEYGTEWKMNIYLDREELK
jgi:hypothetical protein